MRTVLTLMALSIVPSVSFAGPSPAEMAEMARSKQITQEVRQKGPQSLIGRKCANLDGLKLYGGITPAPRLQAKFKASGVKIFCGGAGNVNRVALFPEFARPKKLPHGVNWQMSWKDVWKAMKAAGLKKQVEKGKEDDGAYLVLTGKGGKKFTFKWTDKKGKTPIQKIIIERA